MGTTFSQIYDQFMQFVTDYRLNALYNSSVADFEVYLSGFLIPAITDFKRCRQSLAYTSMTFAETLTTENIKILALLMKKYYLIKEIDNITQVNLHVQDKDFKLLSEANGLREKKNRLILEQENLSQMLVDYGLDDVSMWTNFLSGVFFVP